MAGHRDSVRCRQYRNGLYAFGMAVNLLRRSRPFSTYEFGKFSNVLMGEIQRKHYVFAISADRPVGYVGWALCNESIARAWVESRNVPTYRECMEGDCWVGITYYAESTPVCWTLARYCRNLYPELKVYGIRDYGGRERPTNLRNSGLRSAPKIGTSEVETDSLTAFGHSRS